MTTKTTQQSDTLLTTFSYMFIHFLQYHNPTILEYLYSAILFSSLSNFKNASDEMQTFLLIFQLVSVPNTVVKIKLTNIKRTSRKQLYSEDTSMYWMLATLPILSSCSPRANKTCIRLMYNINTIIY